MPPLLTRVEEMRAARLFHPPEVVGGNSDNNRLKPQKNPALAYTAQARDKFYLPGLGPKRKFGNLIGASYFGFAHQFLDIRFANVNLGAGEQMPADSIVIFAAHHHVRVHLGAVILDADIARKRHQFHFFVDYFFIVFLFGLVIYADRRVRHRAHYAYDTAFYLVIVAKIGQGFQQIFSLREFK